MPSSFNKPINYQAIREKLIQYKADFQLLKKKLNFSRKKRYRSFKGRNIFFKKKKY